MAQSSALLMTMSDVAALARVRRPVVSVWRTRAAGTAHPFPAPVTERRGQALFDAAQVGQWLSDTQRGNNPEARADASAHATLDDAAPRDQAKTGTALTALLALRCVLGRPLGGMSHEELLDAADAQDPDDLSFSREIETAENLSELANYVDDLVEAAYTNSATFERLRDASVEHPDPLSALALQLIARTAIALAETQPGERTFVDVSGTASDLAIAISNESHEDFTIVAPDNDETKDRRYRRRLIAHGIPRRPLLVQEDGSFSLTGPVTHLAQFAETTAMETLTAIDQTALQMDDAQLAVMIAPASVLSDAELSREAGALRSMILRSGRVRAIVRLPAGLLPRKPQQAMALWVLGAAHANIDLADRWTLTADLTAHRLDPASLGDLVEDLVASIGDRATVHAHAFRFARPALTRSLLASRGSLVAGSSSLPITSPSGAELAVRVDELVDALRTEASVNALSEWKTEATEPAITSPRLTIEQRISALQLSYIPGNRLDAPAIVTGAMTAANIRVIGTAEIHGDQPVGSRAIDRLRFAADYPAGRVTEPGDVIFCTTPAPRAIVDTEGTSVVAYPARILRLAAGDDAALIADIVALDINALPPQHKRWQSWMLREVQPLQRVALSSALASIRSLRHDATLRLSRLDELSTLLMAGASAGTLTLTPASETSAPPKGTI